MVKLSNRYRNTLLSVGLCFALMVLYYQIHDVLPKSAIMTLDRGACQFGCPVYRVNIWNDGHVLWHGDSHVAVTGDVSYKISPTQAAALYTRFKAAAFNGLKPAYIANITDQPADHVCLTVGKAVKCVTDYAGQAAGMPAAVGDLESAMDNLAQTHSLIRRDAGTNALLASATYKAVPITAASH